MTLSLQNTLFGLTEFSRPYHATGMLGKYTGPCDHHHQFSASRCSFPSEHQRWRRRTTCKRITPFLKRREQEGEGATICATTRRKTRRKAGPALLPSNVKLAWARCSSHVGIFQIKRRGPIDNNAAWCEFYSNKPSVNAFYLTVVRCCDGVCVKYP